MEESKGTPEANELKIQMGAIENSWKNIHVISRERKRKFDQIKVSSENCHTEIVEVSDWLTGAEKNFGQLENVPSSLNEAESLLSKLEVCFL